MGTDGLETGGSEMRREREATLYSCRVCVQRIRPALLRLAHDWLVRSSPSRCQVCAKARGAQWPAHIIIPGILIQSTSAAEGHAVHETSVRAIRQSPSSAPRPRRV